MKKTDSIPPLDKINIKLRALENEEFILICQQENKEEKIFEGTDLTSLGLKVAVKDIPEVNKNFTRLSFTRSNLSGLDLSMLDFIESSFKLAILTISTTTTLTISFLKNQ